MPRHNESRRKILDASERIFSEKGYFSASTDEIAVQAGVAKGTLYYNFKSKGEIFETLVTEGLEELHRQSEDALDESLDIQDQIRILVHIHIHFASSYPELTRIFLSEMSAGLEESVRQSVSRLKDQYLDFIIPLIKEGQDMGSVIQGDPAFIARALINILNTVGNSASSDLKEEESTLLEQMILTGMSPCR